jgi:hypothetical protein
LILGFGECETRKDQYERETAFWSIHGRSPFRLRRSSASSIPVIAPCQSQRTAAPWPGRHRPIRKARCAKRISRHVRPTSCVNTGTHDRSNAGPSWKSQVYRAALCSSRANMLQPRLQAELLKPLQCRATWEGTAAAHRDESRSVVPWGHRDGR